MMADVKPLKSGSGRYEQPRDLSPIKPRPKDDGKSLEDGYFYIGDGQWLDIPSSFSKNGRGQNDIKRLQSGYYPVVADVDLHGYTQEEAQQVLNEFIAFVQRRGGMRGNYPWQRIGFLRVSAKVEKPGSPLADDASRRFGLRRTA